MARRSSTRFGRHRRDSASTFVHDADGSRLLRTTGTTTTVYLDGMEITATPSAGGGTTLDATRYYGNVAMRTSSGVTVLLRNRQNSSSTAYDPASDTVTYRRYTPFGARRGATPWAATERLLDIAHAAFVQPIKDIPDHVGRCADREWGGCVRLAFSVVEIALSVVPVAKGGAAATRAAKAELRNAGFELAYADVTHDKDERALLQSLGDALGFPEYYRPNWDAFDDCLGDLLRAPAAPTALVIDGADELLRAHPHGFVRAAHLLCSAVEVVEREQGTFRLEVFYLGTGLLVNLEQTRAGPSRLSLALPCRYYASPQAELERRNDLGRNHGWSEW